MKSKSLEDKIAVMQHYLQGGEILVNGELWESSYAPTFCWADNDYSIYEEPKTKPSINWEHVSREFNYLAMDESGNTYLYDSKPDSWDGYCTLADAFSSFVAGDCDWEDSLVCRPGFKDK